jgi:hypothetical protein
VGERKPFLLRVSPELLEQLRRWADDEMRSLNAQIEFVLRQALKQRGRPAPEEQPPERKREKGK